MSAPRFYAKRRITFVASTAIARWQVYDKVKDKFVGKEYRLYLPAVRYADRMNAKSLKQADAYRKAKDNG